MKYLMSVNEAYKAFGIGRDKLNELVRTNQIPTIKDGSRTKINTRLFQEWIDEKTRNGEKI